MSLRTLEEVRCNLCGSGAQRELYHRPYRAEAGDAFAATTDRFHDYGRIVRCSSCGLAFTSPRPRAADLLEGYVQCADQDYAAEASSRSINAHLSLSVIKRFASGGRLLEVGSAAGYFLNAARVDFEVVGLEPSAWACGIAREKFRLDCYEEALEATTRFAPASFDVVAMIDVLEHLADPKASVRRAWELLKPGGLLYLVTPDIGSLSARILGGYWWGLRPAHVYYFDRTTLRRLLAETGFEVALAKSFGRIFTWGYWASRFRDYPGWIHGGLRGVISAAGLDGKFLYLDTRDSVEVCAVKPPVSPSMR